MVRALRANASTANAWRLLAPLLAVALLLTIEGAVPPPVDAGAADGWAAIRQRQLRAETTMLRADRQIRQLQALRQGRARHLRAAKRRLDVLVERRASTRSRAARTAERLELQRQILARALRVHPDPTGKQLVDKPRLRQRVRQLAARHAQLKQQVRKLERKVGQARKRKQQASRKVTRERIEARKQAREAAEDRLGAAISQLLALTKERASTQLATATRKGFRRPAAGRTSQPYGCTGYHANPSRGSCRHFHDGIDIATPRGAAVRASADGYVAFVGRNPWDDGRRAFVVIVGHERGFETVYAHLKPARKVRAGQRVKRGQVIGVVGMTGHTSGPHVHWEVKQHGRALDPRRAGR